MADQPSNSAPQQNALMAIAPMDFRAGYRPATWINNTQLNPMQERDFQVWAKKRSAKLGRNVMNDMGDYDLRADFLAQKGLDARGHGSDIGKKPNHPTFSTGSKYSHPGQMGGTWTDESFIPSPDMMRDPERMRMLAAYMKRNEPDQNFLSPYIARPQ
jgi:hypothetical protein